MAEALDIAGGIGGGLAQAVPNLLQAARDERSQANYEREFAAKQPALEAQASIQQSQARIQNALEPGAIEQYKKEQERNKKLDTPMPMERVTKAHPMIPYMVKDYSAIAGWDENKTEITPRELQEGMKHYNDNPKEGLKVATQFHQDTLEKVKNYNNSITELQDKLKTLEPGPDDDKIKDTQEKIAEAQKAVAPLEKNRIEAATTIKQLNRQIEFGQLSKLTDNQLYTLSETTQDPETKKTVNSILENKRTGGAANEFKTFYRGFKQKNPDASEAEISNAWQELKVKLQQSRYGKYIQISGLPGMGFNRYENEMTPMKLPPGVELDNITSQIAANKAYQNQKKQYEATMQVVVSAAKDKDTLLTTSDNYKRGNYPAPNAVTNWTAKQFGSQERQKEYAQFEVALLAFSRKYMRIVTGAARSVAELSINAQKGSDIISKFDSWDVLKSRVEQAQKEIDNEQIGYKVGMDAMEEKLREFGGKPGATPKEKTSDPLGIL